ncbi:unnamed protein product [Urochloa decumbens]|uniref:RWP-RK domain-containing protein n=1 Tax=Urochloa decumbens TaxID=240449 RepID=A0ABC9CGZ9_9POAL
MEEPQFYEGGDNYRGFRFHEDEIYFQLQGFSADDYLLGEESSFSTQHDFCAISCSERSSSQDELGCLFEIDFASFWAQVEEEDARRKSKEDDCEKALINLEPGSGILQKGAEIGGRPRSGPGGKTKNALTFELVSGHFCLPIKQAAQELNVGVTVLKKRCRELGIPRWPHRKVKSMQTLINNIQELGKLTEKEDGHLTRSMVEILERTKKQIEESPGLMLNKETKELRQACFKESFKRRRLMVMGHGTGTW